MYYSTQLGYIFHHILSFSFQFMVQERSRISFDYFNEAKFQAILSFEHLRDLRYWRVESGRGGHVKWQFETSCYILVKSLRSGSRWMQKDLYLSCDNEWSTEYFFVALIFPFLLRPRDHSFWSGFRHYQEKPNFPQSFVQHWHCFLYCWNWQSIVTLFQELNCPNAFLTAQNAEKPVFGAH